MAEKLLDLYAKHLFYMFFYAKFADIFYMAQETIKKKRDFIGVTYKCCRVYSRIYINHKKNAYIGFCPRCGAKLEVFISKNGSKSRFFEAG